MSREPTAERRHRTCLNTTPRRKPQRPLVFAVSVSSR
nr:MAG TPA: hypothetical protein [Caudoviricetes sp.]DAV32385.1 MAG TPA: hypothetical protein [Caudoviricetes sp.]